jgi:rubrerythrin
MSVRDAAVVALGEAVKFESDGRDFYLRSAEAVQNPLARSVFLALADDEKDHIRRVREIYEELKDKPGWPDVTTMVTRTSGVLGVFEAAAASLPENTPVDLTAEQALAKAREMERQGLAFYRDRQARASCDAEAEFFRRLVSEEEVHMAALEKVLDRLG